MNFNIIRSFQAIITVLIVLSIISCANEQQNENEAEINSADQTSTQSSGENLQNHLDEEILKKLKEIRSEQSENANNKQDGALEQNTEEAETDVNQVKVSTSIREYKEKNQGKKKVE
jgi:hypothetical protein